jgi:MFS family permease
MEGAIAAEPASTRDRKNFLLGVTQGVSFHAGSPFIHATTILPTFLFALVGSHALCGFIVTIQQFAQVIPQLWGARHINHMPYKKPFLIGVAVFRVACWVGIAVAALIWGTSNPKLVIVIFFLGLSLFYITGGIGQIAFHDFIRKVIRSNAFGAFFGWRSFLGGGVAVLAAFVARWILSLPELFPHPIEHSMLFLFAALFLGVQVFCVLPIEEPPTQTYPHREPLIRYLKDLITILRSNRWFRTLVCTKLLLGGVLLTTPYYVIFSLEKLGQPQIVVGTYTILLMVSKSMGGLLWGKLEDRHGHKTILIIVGCVGLLPYLLAFFSGLTNPWLMHGVFFSLGLTLYSKDMLVRNYLLEQSPRDSVPVFSALLNTLSAPIMVFPLIGALIIKLAGYQALFVSAMVVTLVGIIAATRLPGRQEVIL